jgi:cytoskeletal protein CcmA (bactofilin family)
MEGKEMFGKEGAEQQAAVSSILGKDCKFTGDVDAKGTIRVDGEFNGKIVSSDSVIVGKGGVVKGEIHTVHTLISGTVEGNVFAKKKVELESGSRLVGDIESMSLVIEDGVYFEGMSKMRKEGDTLGQRPRFVRAEETPEPEKVKVKD